MTDEQKQLILKHKSLAQIVAGQMYKVLAYKMEYDDVLQCAYLGLIDALEKFQPEKNIRFEAYAPHRIRGYILDEVRRLDVVSKHSRAKIKAGLEGDIKFCSYEDCSVPVPFKFSADKVDLELAISKLPLIERQIIYYHYVDGLPLAKIGPKVGRCYVTVIYAHKRALRKLRKLVA